jgi:hypothetical protein
MQNVDAKLPGLEFEGVKYLYNLDPKSNNLFYAASLTDESGAVGSNTLGNEPYRLNKISFPFSKLNFEPPSRGIPFPLLKGVTLGSTCSITWVENADKQIERYHQDWMRHWYKRETDALVVGKAGKYRTLKVYPFKYRSTYRDDTPYIDDVVAVTMYEIIITNLVPIDIKNIEYDMNEPGSPLITYEYSLDRATVDSSYVSPTGLTYV